MGYHLFLEGNPREQQQLTRNKESMSQFGGSGYKGFRSWSAQECPTLKPGETDEHRNTKYNSMASRTNEMKFQMGDLGYSTLSNDSYSRVKQGDFKKPDRRGVMVKSDERDSATQSRPFIGNTTYQNHFDLTSRINVSLFSSFLRAFLLRFNDSMLKIQHR